MIIVAIPYFSFKITTKNGLIYKKKHSITLLKTKE